MVPVRKSTQDDDGDSVGTFYFGYDGTFRGPQHKVRCQSGVTYAKGDAITVTLDLDASSVAFAKNDIAVAKPLSLTNEAYYFAINAIREITVTITSMK